MARSTKIYLVMQHNVGTDDIMAAFTVKHEAVTWFGDNCNPRRKAWIVSTPDGSEFSSTEVWNWECHNNKN